MLRVFGVFYLALVWASPFVIYGIVSSRQLKTFETEMAIRFNRELRLSNEMLHSSGKRFSVYMYDS